jgi:DNA invertase Pin-like site-specific DNA recombinase
MAKDAKKLTSDSLAVGYVRVSTERQADSGLGLEAQESAIKDAAKRLGLTLAASYRDEGLSGSLPLSERPGLLDAVSALKPGMVLLVARRDRLARDMVISALVEREVAKRKAKLVSAAGEGSELDGPSGELVRAILDAVAQHERAQIALRTRLALRAKKARGERAGNCPFGFKAESTGKLVPEPTEQEVIELARRLRRRGHSFRAVVAKLRAKGKVGRTGKPLGLRQVWHLLRRGE